MKNVPSNLSNLKIKVDKLDVDNLVPVPVDLSNLSDVVKNDDVKKDVYNAKIKDIANLATTTTSLIAVENKIPGRSKYITTLEFNKLTAENFAARLPQTNIASKNDIAHFIKKTDFDDKLKNLNKRINLNTKITPNKRKHFLVENEFKKLQTFDPSLFIDQSYFNRSTTLFNT